MAQETLNEKAGCDVDGSEDDIERRARGRSLPEAGLETYREIQHIIFVYYMYTIWVLYRYISNHIIFESYLCYNISISEHGYDYATIEHRYD